MPLPLSSCHSSLFCLSVFPSSLLHPSPHLISSHLILLSQLSSNSRNEILELNDRHEIVSLVGTFDSEQHCHLHTSLSDGEGKTIGGHVFEMTVFTTAEIVIGTAPLLLFKREDDPQTGFDELVVYSKENSS
jgi:predicted DNA-binding protein with PD1-like motif